METLNKRPSFKHQQTSTSTHSVDVSLVLMFNSVDVSYIKRRLVRARTADVISAVFVSVVRRFRRQTTDTVRVRCLSSETADNGHKHGGDDVRRPCPHDTDTDEIDHIWGGGKTRREREREKVGTKSRNIDTTHTIDERIRECQLPLRIHRTYRLRWVGYVFRGSLPFRVTRTRRAFVSVVRESFWFRSVSVHMWSLHLWLYQTTIWLQAP